MVACMVRWLLWRSLFRWLVIACYYIYVCWCASVYICMCRGSVVLVVVCGGGWVTVKMGMGLGGW